MIQNKLYPVLFLLTALSLFSCNKKKESKVESNGLTKEINELVPQEILDKIKALGVPIHGGDTPPNIEGAFNVSPDIIVQSTAGDLIGFVAPDFKITFYEQNDNDLTIKIDFLTGTQSGTGLGSYIVGTGCKFSVFVELRERNINNQSEARLIYVFSGSMTDNGIEDISIGNLMLDDFGDPFNCWITVGTGRVFNDGDRFSERQGTSAAWYAALPPCPCTYADVQNNRRTNCPDGEWLDCGTASQAYHYGAKYEVRWVPDQSEKPGQQCTYDQNGRLITAGIAAGTPDKDSPDICGWGDIFTGQGFPDYDHYTDDVVPWSTIPCIQYLQGWPPNNARACAANPVTDIQHMLGMVANMTCEEITYVFEAVDGSAQVSAEIKDYFHGRLNYTPSSLKSSLQALYAALGCNDDPDEDNCLALKKAIDNL